MDNNQDGLIKYSGIISQSLIVGIPSLAFADKPISITVWVNEKDNTIAKVQIDEINANQAIMNLGEKNGQEQMTVEKAISTYEVIGIDTFDELLMPE